MAVGVRGVVAEVGVVGAGGVAVGVGGVEQTRDIWNGPGKFERQKTPARRKSCSLKKNEGKNG